MQRNPHSDSNKTNSYSGMNTLDALNRAEANSRGENLSRSDNKATSVRTNRNLASQRSNNVRRSSSQSRPATDRPASSASRSTRPATDRSASSANRTRNASAQRRSSASSSRNAGAVSAERKRSSSQSKKAEMQRNLSNQREQMQRRMNGSNQNSASNKKKKKKSGFKKFITIYSIILIVILIVGLIIFNSFIATYENNQPVNIASTVADNLSGDNAKAYLEENKSNIKTLENVDTLIDKCVENLQGKDVSFVQSDDYTETDPAYNLTVDGNQVGKLTLESDGTGAFGLKKWKIKNLDVVSYIADTYSYTILCPKDDKVYVNGTELSEDFITAKDSVPAILENVQDLIATVPTYNTYTVNGFLSIPTVTATDASGNDVGVAESTESFVVGGKPDQSFIDEQKDFVENALTAWAYHFINYGSMNLENYVASGTDLHDYIFGSDTMDPIYTAFYDWEYISSVNFTEFSADNYIKYTDDCYSVDVKYKLEVTFNNGNPVDDDQQLDATWVVIKKDGNWGIADIQYHSNGDSTLSGSSSSSSSDTSSTTSSSTTDETTTSATGETTTGTDETTTSSTTDTTTEAETTT